MKAPPTEHAVHPLWSTPMKHGLARQAINQLTVLVSIVIYMELRHDWLAVMSHDQGSDWLIEDSWSLQDVLTTHTHTIDC